MYTQDQLELNTIVSEHTYTNGEIYSSQKVKQLQEGRTVKHVLCLSLKDGQRFQIVFDL